MRDSRVRSDKARTKTNFHEQEGGEIQENAFAGDGNPDRPARPRKDSQSQGDEIETSALSAEMNGTVIGESAVYAIGVIVYLETSAYFFFPLVSYRRRGEGYLFAGERRIGQQKHRSRSQRKCKSAKRATD